MKQLRIRYIAKRTLLVSAAILGAGALVLTFSRSAWAAAAGISITYFVLRKKRKSMLMPFLFTVLLVVFLAGLVLHGIDFSSESVVVRQQLSVAALALWRQSPLVGVGLGNFLIELPRALPVRSIYFLQPVHNVYLMILSETGLIGLVTFLWVVYRSLTGGVRSSLFPLRISLLVLLLLGFVDHYAVTLQQGQLLFTLLISLCLSTQHTHVRRMNKRSRIKGYIFWG